MRVDDEEREVEYLIFPAVFRNEVCQGYSWDAAQRALYVGGYLIRRERANFTNKPRLPGLGTKQRVYCVRATILEGDE